METPEEKAAREAAEDAAASGGFEDDLAEQPVVTPEALTGAQPAAEEDEDEDEIEVPEGAHDPDAVRKAIKAERQAARRANAHARELEARLRDLEAANATPASEPSEQAQAAEARALKLEIALDKGLSKTLALRLQGTTREEMEADAESLLAEVGPRRTGGMDGGYRQDPPPPAVPADKAHNDFLVGLLTQTRQQ